MKSKFSIKNIGIGAAAFMALATPVFLILKKKKGSNPVEEAPVEE